MTMHKNAVLSADGVYRYDLLRRWGPDTNLLRWVMLGGAQ